MKFIFLCTILLLIPLTVVAKPLLAKQVRYYKPAPVLKASIVDAEIVNLPNAVVNPIVKQPSIPDLIRQYSAQYGIDPTIPLKVAKCESGYQYAIKNKTSSASGTFQFINSTWVSTRKQMGENPDLALKLDPVEGVKTGVWKIANGGIRAWDASLQCHKSR